MDSCIERASLLRELHVSHIKHENGTGKDSACGFSSLESVEQRLVQEITFGVFKRAKTVSVCLLSPFTHCYVRSCGIVQRQNSKFLPRCRGIEFYFPNFGPFLAASVTYTRVWRSFGAHCSQRFVISAPRRQCFGSVVFFDVTCQRANDTTDKSSSATPQK